MDIGRRRLLGGLAAAPMVAAFGAASLRAAPREPPVDRAWRMGFSHLPPRATVADVIRTIDLWAPRAELAIHHDELPWRELLAGASPESLIARDLLQLVAYLRDKGLGIVFVGEANNGLAREAEAPQLAAAGRSLGEASVQKLYRDYLLAVCRMVRPDWLLLAAETNLVRAIAPAPLYGAIVSTCRRLAGELRAANVTTPLGISVQVETAWGLLGSRRGYVGIAEDLRDFPFAEFIGLSSYPYLAWPAPEAIPDDYYLRLRAVANVPMMVSEGGWTSARVGSLHSTPRLQAQYIRRHASLLDSVAAFAWLQLPFTDIDLRRVPRPWPANLPLFTRLGLVDERFRAKPALAAWDELHRRPLRAAEFSRGAAAR